MKRLPLTAQITLIFIAAFLITSILLSVFITRRLDNLYENNIYEKLEAEARVIRLANDLGDYQPVENIAYIKYFSADNTYIVSDNLMDYIDEEARSLLLGKALSQKSFEGRYTNVVNGNQIYYVVLNYQGVLAINEDVTISIAASAMKDDMISETRKEIYYICILSFTLGYIVIFIWITKFAGDTKRISDALKKIGDNYFKKKITTRRKDEVGELVKSIEHMRRRIVENERLRQEIIQGVSHDLKTPIALISSYAEAYEDGMCEASEIADIAKKETKRLNAKVSKLLNLTRLGYIDANLQTIGNTDMKGMLEELVSMYVYQDKIKIHLEANESMFLGDKDSWYIAIQNILDNAMRYAKSEINIYLDNNTLSIFNDGDKIDENILPNIFNAYEKGKGGSFGIGLSIVKRTVELFGYDVKAQNSDEGVTFIIFEKDD